MRQATPALVNFLSSATTMVCPDLYTITLASGQVLRWTSADIPIVAGGQTYQPVAGIEDQGVKSRRGVQVDNLTIDMSADERHTVNGVPLIQFIRRGGMNNANILVQRAYAASWEEMRSTGPVGSVVRFAGRVSEVPDGGSSQASIVCASWMELLNVMMPADVHQASCLNSIYDSRCGVSRAAFQRSGQVTAQESLIRVSVSVSETEGYLSGGAILFTSGSCLGQRRTIRTHSASGVLVLVAPLPAPPAAGDTVLLWPGCNLSMQTCLTKFNNLAKFRGQPFIPDPEMAV
jgi:uncharacterized phage protein (TIGR02218 family)